MMNFKKMLRTAGDTQVGAILVIALGCGRTPGSPLPQMVYGFIS